jgi:hypothetical protein
VTLAGIATTTAQSPADQVHGWVRSGNVTALAAAIDKNPDLAARADAEGVQPLDECSRPESFRQNGGN